MEPGNTSLQAVASINCRGAYKQTILEQRNIQHDRKRFWIPYKPMEEKEGNHSYSGEILIERADGLFQAEISAPVVRSCLNGMPFVTKRQKLEDIQDDVAFRGICKTDGEDPVCVISGLTSMINNGKFPFKRGDTVCAVFPDPNQVQPKRKTMQTQPYHLTTPNLSPDALNAIIGSPDMTKFIYMFLKTSATIAFGFLMYVGGKTGTEKEELQERSNEVLFGVKEKGEEMENEFLKYIKGERYVLAEQYINYALTTGIDNYIDFAIELSLINEVDSEKVRPNIAAACKIAISLFQKGTIAYAQDHRDIVTKDIITPLFNVAQAILAKSSNSVIGVCQSNGLPGERIDVFVNPTLKTQATRNSTDPLKIPNIHTREGLRVLLSDAMNEYAFMMGKIDKDGNPINPTPPSSTPPPPPIDKIQQIFDRLFIYAPGYVSRQKYFETLNMYERNIARQKLMVSKFILASFLPVYNIEVRKNYTLIADYIDGVYNDVAHQYPYQPTDLVLMDQHGVEIIKILDKFGVDNPTLTTFHEDIYQDDSAVHWPLSFKTDDIFFDGANTTKYTINTRYPALPNDIIEQFTVTETKYTGDFEFYVNNYVTDEDFQVYYVTPENLIALRQGSILAEYSEILEYLEETLIPWLLSLSWKQRLPWLRYITGVDNELVYSPPNETWRYLVYMKELNRHTIDQFYSDNGPLKRNTQLHYDIISHIILNVVDYTNATIGEITDMKLLPVYRHKIGEKLTEFATYKVDMKNSITDYIKGKFGEEVKGNIIESVSVEMHLEDIYKYAVTSTLQCNRTASEEIRSKINKWFPCDSPIGNVEMEEALSAYSEPDWHELSINIMTNMIPFYGFLMLHNDIAGINLNDTYKMIAACSSQLNKGFTVYMKYSKDPINEYQTLLKNVTDEIQDIFEDKNIEIARLTALHTGSTVDNHKRIINDVITVLIRFLNSEEQLVDVPIAEGVKHKMTSVIFMSLMNEYDTTDTAFMDDLGNRNATTDINVQLNEALTNVENMIQSLSIEGIRMMQTQITGIMNRVHSIYSYDTTTNTIQIVEYVIDIILQYPTNHRQHMYDYIRRIIEENIDDPSNVDDIVPAHKPYEKFRHVLNKYMLKRYARMINADEFSPVRQWTLWCIDDTTLEELVDSIDNSNANRANKLDAARVWIATNTLAAKIKPILTAHGINTGDVVEYGTLLSDYNKASTLFEEVKMAQLEHQGEFINAVIAVVDPAPAAGGGAVV